ncbi:MAG: hypothetical protein KDD37_10660 [Bdellovibrionales bacterium]|nr:hypothetical protein [Bdellovibrionales bacterium]
MKNYISFALISFLIGSIANAQRVEVDEKGRVVRGQQDSVPTGKKAADKYMTREVEGPVSDGGYSGGNESHFLALHIGPYVDSQVHNWGVKDKKNEGEFTAAVTYRVGEWVNSTDFLVRVGWQSVEINNNSTSKISLMPIIAFPDARAKFPLYFGAGLGLGVFLDQVDNESSLSMDYTILLGTRFFNVFDTIGIMLEVGIDNHIFLTSKGQFSGTYVALGTVFEF